MELFLKWYQWIQENWVMVSFIVVYLVEQVLPKINKVEANSTSELVAELLKLLVKLVKKDYSQPKVESSEPKA